MAEYVTPRPTYSLAEVRQMNGWPDDAKFMLLDGPIYTREQVEKAVNAGANLVQTDQGIGGELESDMINIVVNAQLTLLDRPECDDLDEVLNENWAGGDYDTEEYDSPAAWVRSWWGGWS